MLWKNLDCQCQTLCPSVWCGCTLHYAHDHLNIKYPACLTSEKLVPTQEPVEDIWIYSHTSTFYIHLKQRSIPVIYSYTSTFEPVQAIVCACRLCTSTITHHCNMICMEIRPHHTHALCESLQLEFASAYQRLCGKRVLFPQGFHCTGMPIKVREALQAVNWDSIICLIFALDWCTHWLLPASCSWQHLKVAVQGSFLLSIPIQCNHLFLSWFGSKRFHFTHLRDGSASPYHWPQHPCYSCLDMHVPGCVYLCFQKYSVMWFLQPHACKSAGQTQP